MEHFQPTMRPGAQPRRFHLSSKGLLCGFITLAAICGGPANSVALDSTWTSTWAGNAGGRI